MATEGSAGWALTTTAGRVRLVEGRGEITVTVTNTQPVDRDVTVVLLTDESIRVWFTVINPTRTVPAGGEASFTVHIAAPANTPAGEYAVQAKAYNADEAAEESDCLSPRIVVEIAQALAARRRFRLWWLAVPVAAAAAAAVVTVIIALLPTWRSVETVAVPDLSNLDEQGVIDALEGAGLTYTIRHRHDENPGPVVQVPPKGTQVTRGTNVLVTISVSLSAPTIDPALLAETTQTMPRMPLMAPAEDGDFGVPGLTPARLRVDLAWSQEEEWVTSWRVVIMAGFCQYNPTGPRDVGVKIVEWTTTSSPSLSTIRYLNLTGDDTTTGIYDCSDSYTESWSVAALDDFGQPGPNSIGRYSWEP